MPFRSTKQQQRPAPTLPQQKIHVEEEHETKTRRIFKKRTTRPLCFLTTFSSFWTRIGDPSSFFFSYYGQQRQRTRKIVWMATLILMFLMERHRTMVRSKRTAAAVGLVQVVSGIILETPDDTFPIAQQNKQFVNMTTGSLLYTGTKGCDAATPSSSRTACRIHLPFVDLSEFKKEHGQRKRLKQVLSLPPNDESTVVSLALLSQRGIGTNHEDGNQDRSMILHPFHVALDGDHAAADSASSSSSSVVNTDFLMVLLDGHGNAGNTVAQTAMDNLPLSLTKELQKAMTMTGANSMTQLQHSVMTQVMINTFHRVDQHVATAVTDTAIIDATSGTTMTVALKLGDHLHIANVGDSQTFVVSYSKTTTTTTDGRGAAAEEADEEDGTVNILYATRPDKPDLPDERQRILDNGGSLWLPPPTARGDQPPPRVYLEGLTDPVTNNTRNYVLALSRSIGDAAAHAMAGVVADPMVASLQVSAFLDGDDHKQLFVFSASDGLLQKMAPLGIANRLAASLYHQDKGSRGTVSPLETIEGIILDANEAWSKSRSVENNELKDYRDDMTLTVVKVLH